MPNKSLGQHWLKDRAYLEAIADAAHITSQDTVVEIGPGLGTLTSVLLARAGKVISVEFDAELARKLPGQFPGKNLEVVQSDILSFDFASLPDDFKVVGNIPYYITNKIVRKVLESPNKPSISALLVQKEVAERIAAGPGEMSMLALAAQVYAEASLGVEVPREYFTPPPEVDSQVIVLKTRSEPLVPLKQQAEFFRLARAGFSEKRKKLRSSLAGGLHLEKTVLDTILEKLGISPEARAQELSIDDWKRLQRELF